MNRKSFRESSCSVLVFLFIFSIFCPIPAVAWSGKTVGVSDGDTIKVLHNGIEEKIRMYGIDCPEKGQDFGQKAQDFTAKLVAGKAVEIKSVTTDRYGRSVAWVYVDNTCVNEELLKAGLAWHYKKYSTDARLKEMEADAKKSRSGLWSASPQIAPWDFRNDTRPKQLLAGSGVIYHGNINSYKFHRPGCQHYNCKNCTATFNSREAAIAAGYAPCKICKP